MKETDRYPAAVYVAVAVAVGVIACGLAPVAVMLGSAVAWYVLAGGLTR